MSPKVARTRSHTHYKLMVDQKAVPIVCQLIANSRHCTEQELMSGEATKERATTAYARVPSKSKLLASELPNMETSFSIERHNDDIKTHVFCGSDVRI